MRLTMLAFLTLDGVMQSNGKPEPELEDGFVHGGWQVPYIDEELLQIHAGFVAAADAFLFGRRTYELFAGHWPHVTDPDDPFATHLNSRPKYVASDGPDQAGWRNTVMLRGDIAAEVSELKSRPGGELQIHGSAALVRSLMRHELIDEFRLYVHPIVLGAGRRLFSEGTVPAALDLVDTRHTDKGVVLQVLRPAGTPSYGTAALEQAGDVIRDTVSGPR